MFYEYDPRSEDQAADDYSGMPPWMDERWTDDEIEAINDGSGSEMPEPEGFDSDSDGDLDGMIQNW
jgi:hypothetical protein